MTPRLGLAVAPLKARLADFAELERHAPKS
jgi:hypothetical protein